MSTTARKARKRAGQKLVVAPKMPTPPAERSHTWRHRFDAKRQRWETRPTLIGRDRYGIRDIGWQKESKYFTAFGKLRKSVQA
ncbi:hypothetical protein Q9R08_04980 [Microbacterium sp. QXD-8]|uniref:Uncharacterized protein n=1 Tax=Microbacterium psychrotolerans TaxID=3068321 RepID=A0ABU0YYB7_9MICO|nr:hypothetical protein [Microbacterium sp. QXD-8]MDQ7877326.1 hypothetical protein [Microbacterium sp. QXD-8]